MFDQLNAKHNVIVEEAYIRDDISFIYLQDAAIIIS